MAQDASFASQRRRLEKDIRRLAEIVPGYHQLCQSTHGEVSITRIDFTSVGHRRISLLDERATLSDPEKLSQWAVETLTDITTRYLLVEDADSDAWFTLGATFAIEPQFFLDHMNCQVSQVPASERDQRIRWNAWGLPRSYLSFHWYRPVTRSRTIDSALRRRQIEERYERITLGRYRDTAIGELDQECTVDIVHPLSAILRPEWDLSMSSGIAAEGVVAIEERVSIYQTMRSGCQIIIMLLDPTPKALKATWSERHSALKKPYIPPPNTAVEVVSLYDSLVPRFTPDFTTTSITDFHEPQLKEIYETLFSTLTCLRRSFRAASQIPATDQLSRAHLPFLHLFSIVVSDTQGLLHILDAVQREIVQFTASQNAQLDDILAKRTFIAKLLAQIPPHSRDLIKALRELLKRSNIGEPSQEEVIIELAHSFENTIQNLKEAANAITGTIQFIESHRAILEAESITRLTELAFLFIPLSFAASLFSMQIDQLATPVPVGNFIAFALSLSTSTYALRLAARSAWVHNQKQRILTSIRTRSSAPPGAPIPNRVIFAWAISRLAPTIILLLAVACFVVPPFVVIWRRPLDVGLKIGLTFLFLTFIVTVVGMVVLVVPVFRNTLRDGMQIHWYNAVMAEEDGPAEERRPLRTRIMRWIAGRVD
ncbi:uncharacterized protein BDW70DRAFT_81113 [Aspergillus foveolatus]|uniref:uncharacterized protein n=1 Tax=Aspergillus foveolatus TaxID=210207 RepID=UPI003CCCBA88